MMSNVHSPMFPGRRVIDLRAKPVRVAPVVITEWMQYQYDSTHIRVIGGPVMWSNVRCDDESASYDVDFSGMGNGDVRWLFVEINLAVPSVTPKFQADATLPTDDPLNLIVRHRLSQWTFSKPDTVVYASRTMTAWAGGCIHLVPASFGPPIGT